MQLTKSGVGPCTGLVVTGETLAGYYYKSKDRLVSRFWAVNRKWIVLVGDFLVEKTKYPLDCQQDRFILLFLRIPINR
jgi:hypothetical protein